MITFFIIPNIDITVEMFTNSEQTQGSERHTLHGTDRAIFSTEGTPASVFDGYTQYSLSEIRTEIEADEWNFRLSAITDISLAENSLTISGDKTVFIRPPFANFKIKNSLGKDGNYTVASKEYISVENKTKIILIETIPNDTIDGDFLY